MRFFAKKLGLIIWVVTVVAILVVPTWRLRATRQWEQVTGTFAAAFAPAEEPGFATAIVAGAPQDDANKIPFYELSAPWEREVARRFPDDPLAQIAPLHNPGAPMSMGADTPLADAVVARYYARYDALERRFPASNAVRAQRLRDVTQGGIPLIHEFEMPHGEPRPTKANPPPPPAVRAQLKAAIATARAGARIEPDNAFFPWMEAAFSFALRRDAAAIDALRRAGECPRFDDYLMRNVRGRLALLRQVQPVGWEDDYTEIFGALLPHLARMNYAARSVSFRARLARQGGDETRALELVGILQRAGAAARADDLLMTRRVGEALVVRAWKFALEEQPNVPVEPKDDNFFPTTASAALAAQYQQEMATRFEAYARARNQPDLANQARAIAARFDASNSIALWSNGSNGSAFSPMRVVERLGKLWWLASVALLLGAGASLLWLITWPLSRRPRDSAARRGALISAMFVAGASIILLVGLLLLVPTISDSPWSYANSQAPTGVTLWLSERYLPLIVALWLVPVVVPALWQLGAKLPLWRWLRDSKSKFWAIPILTLLVFTVFTVGGAGVAMGLGQTGDSIIGQLFPIFMALWLGCALLGSLLMLALLRGPSRALAFCFVLAFWAGAAPIIFGPQGDGPFYSSISITVAAIAALVGLILALRIWKIPFPSSQIKEFAFDFAARARIAAGVLALLCAIAYSGITLWTIPVEAKTRAMLARQLQIGEVAWLREQMK